MSSSGCGASWTASSPRRPAERSLLAFLLILAAAVLAGACASRGPAPPAVRAPSLPVWELPAEAMGSQRLYRISFSSPQGEGSFRVTLRLISPERYQIQAVDPVGRSLWSLDVAGGRGLWLDHRARTHCTFQGRFELSGLPLGPFPLLSLPSLLLGRVPAQPAGPVQEKDGAVAFLDGSGRRWGASGEDGVVTSWSLAEADTPTVWWRLHDGWAILSDRERDVQIRWRETLRETLAGEIEALTPPAAYRQTPCQDPELP